MAPKLPPPAKTKAVFVGPAWLDTDKASVVPAIDALTKSPRVVRLRYSSRRGIMAQTPQDILNGRPHVSRNGKHQRADRQETPTPDRPYRRSKSYRRSWAASFWTTGRKPNGWASK